MVKQNLVQHTYFPPTSSDLIGEFQQNHRSYQLFVENGLDKDIAGVNESGPDAGKPISTLEKILNDGLFRRLLPFLNAVDPAKGLIQRKVVKLERRRDLDQNNKRSEFLVVHTEWVAKDYLGNELVSTVVKEGIYNNPEIRTELVKGKVVKKYKNWKAVYDIPFTAEAVNEALENQINPLELIKFMVRTSQSHRDDSFSLEQFRDSTFEECQKISADGKGLNR